MNKEELEKEAEQYAVENWEHYEEGQTDYKALKQAYLDSAEPREKRIAELEKHCSNYEMKISKMEKGTCDICKENEKDNRIAELEAQIEKMKCCGNCSHFKFDNSGLYPINVCELTYPNRCKNHDKWEIEEK